MDSVRLDVELVNRGLARSRNRAARLITDAKVSVNGSPVRKPSLPVLDSDQIAIADPDGSESWASRASYKLARALDSIGPDLIQVSGKNCLDVGASTGGFTDVLLRRDAAHVVALDVGHDQLIPELRLDNRVTVVEGYNARELRAKDLPYIPEIVVCDVSFISLKLLLAPLAKCANESTNLLLMVKPQFEVGKENLGSGGVVRDPGLQASAVLDVARSASELGLITRAVIPSALPGPHGNKEFFLWFVIAGQDLPRDLADQRDERLVSTIQNAVEMSASLSAEGDMIEEHAMRSSRKGIPASQLVPNTQVFWV